MSFVGVPRASQQCVSMSVQCCYSRASCSRIPKFDQIVFATTGQHRESWMPIDAFDIPTVTSERCFALATCKVPDFDRHIIGTRRKLAIAWRKRDATNRFFVRRKLFHHVHILLPIFDSTTVAFLLFLKIKIQ